MTYIGVMSYAALAEHHRRLSQLHHVEAIAVWDESTMMPVGGGAARAEALSTFHVNPWRGEAVSVTG